MSALPLLVRAPAKVNLCLYVGPRREDGMHEICSLFQSLTLADELRVEEAAERDEIICPVVPEPNLAAAALQAFRERFRWSGPRLRVTIDKRIPVAAGLGGGSADAAAVLRAAVAVSGIEPRESELVQLAMSLGADVPSQLEPGMDLIRGAGEVVERLDPPLSPGFVLLASPAELRTADVYARADELGLPERDLDAVESELYGAVLEIADMPSALASLLYNDLEEAALDLEPSIAEPLGVLRAGGAQRAIVSGSGPTVFGVFLDVEEAERAAAEIAPRWRGQTIVAGAVRPGYAAPLPA